MYSKTLSLSRTKGKREVNIHTMKMNNWWERPCGWGLVLLYERRPGVKNIFGQNPRATKKMRQEAVWCHCCPWAGTETLQVWHDQKERLCRRLEQTSSKMHLHFHQCLSAMPLSIHLLCWQVGLGNVVVGMGMCCFLTAHPAGCWPQEKFYPLAVQPCMPSGLGVSFGVV